MKNYLFIFALLFCFIVVSEAQFLAPDPPACNLAGPNSFEPTHHRTYNFFGYSEMHVHGNLVNPCGDVVGTHTNIFRRNWE